MKFKRKLKRCFGWWWDIHRYVCMCKYINIYISYIYIIKKIYIYIINIIYIYNHKNIYIYIDYMHIAPSSTSETSANALGIFQPPAESPQPHPAHRAVPVPPVPRASLPPGGWRCVSVSSPYEKGVNSSLLCEKFGKSYNGHVTHPYYWVYDGLWSYPTIPWNTGWLVRGSFS